MYKHALGLIVLGFLSVVMGPIGSAGIAQDETQPMTVRGQVWDSPCAAAGDHGKMMAKLKATDVKDCTLKCVKAGAQFVLYETDTKTIYRLDPQDTMKQYAGQTVTVIGSYDRAAGLLHVDRVETGM